MISPCKKLSGFTLIELLIVLTISMTAVALVGGLSVDYLTKYRAKAEATELKSLLTKAQNLAFITEQAIFIQLSEHVLSITANDKVIEAKTFESLTFSPTNFTFSALGYASQAQVSYVSNNNHYSLMLREMHDAF